MLHVSSRYVCRRSRFRGFRFPKRILRRRLARRHIVVILNESWEDRQTQYTSVSAQTWHGYRKCWRSSTASSVQLLLLLHPGHSFPAWRSVYDYYIIVYPHFGLWHPWAMPSEMWMYSMPWILLLSPLPLLLLLIWMTLFLTQPTQSAMGICVYVSGLDSSSRSLSVQL